MNGCSDIQERLEALLDGRLPESEAEHVRRHLEGCVECRAEEDWLRSLRAHLADLPREVAPGRDLWPGIASRLGLRAAPRRASRPLVVLAAAASLVAAVGLGALLGVYVVGSAGPVGTAGVPGVVTASWRGTDAELERLRGQLFEMVEMRRESLDPEALAVVEDNLRVIDSAIERIEVALRREPESRELRRLLYEARREEIRLLWRAAEMPTIS